MLRIARAIAVGWAHHITQRGNNRQPVFMVDDTRRVYLQNLQEQADKYGLDVLGYCLMTNYVHIVAIPHAEDSLPNHQEITPYGVTTNRHRHAFIRPQ
jgi:putative transposase